MLMVLGVALLASICPAETASPAPAKHHPGRHKAPPKPAVLPPLPPGPLPQLPMDLIPAAPPNVVYENGLLMIAAQNSTLGDILRDVHKLTGASIDIPSNATERVVTRIGPGAPRDVLATLLNGSSFNYVMLGSNSDPTGVASLVLIAKSASGTTQTAANTYQPVQPVYAPQMPGQPLVAQQQVVAQPEDPNAGEQDTVEDNAEQDQPDAQQPDAGAARQEPQQPNAGPKTPEQILEMLRRQQSMPPGTPPQQPPQN
jgi:hypothetical protein